MTYGLFLPIIERAYLKVTPQEQSTKEVAGLDKLKQLALALVPQFDTTKFLIDLVSSEEHSLENVIPSAPLEDGSVLNDHITNLPKRVTLNFVITDTPIDPIDPTFGRIDSYKGRSTDQWGRLKKWRGDNSPWTIVAGLDAYRNMALESLVGTKDNGGYRIVCRAVFTELQIAESSNASKSTFATDTDEEVEHSISAGQAFGVVALASFTF